MSFNVLRTTFSSAIQKRVYSFQCERATAGKRSLHAKLLSAKQNSAVVITTPPAVKSLMLKVNATESDPCGGTESAHQHSATSHAGLTF